MPLKKPPSRLQSQRSSQNDPRRLSRKSPTPSARAQLAARATFVPYAKHKRHPVAYGLKPYAGEDEDPTYCDEHAGFQPIDMGRVQPLLLRGIEAGLFSAITKKGDPGLLWTVDDNGWIYEARVSNPGYAAYHAYPVMPNEAIARKVLLRFADYVAQQGTAALRASLSKAQARYR